MLFCLTFFNFQNYFAKDLRKKKDLKQNNEVNANIPSFLLLSNFYKYLDNEENSNSIYQKEIKSHSYKSPWLAFGLAMMFPGLGQVYNGEYGKLGIIYGVAVVGAGIGTVGLSNSNYGTSKPSPSYANVLFASGLLIISLDWIYSLIDAPISANNINERNRQVSQINKSIIEKNNYKLNFSAGMVKSKYCVGFSMNYGF